MAPFAVRAIPLAALLAARAGTLPAQIIPIKTVPIAQGDQFQIFPSNNLGMGGVSIAIADPLLDPFVNPAKGARVGPARFFTAPTVYSISRGAGGGRMLPVAAVTGAGAWFGGFSLALQEVDPSRPPGFGGGPVILDLVAPGPVGQPTGGSRGNQYAFAMLGKALPAAGVSLGGSVLWSNLNMLDGVDLLYAGSTSIDQSGHSLDLRLGLVKEWTGNRSLEALVLHDRFGMAHDVTFLDQVWDPITQQFTFRQRIEHNVERTNTWGLHLEYERPLTTPAEGGGWRIGWLATANLMQHPKLPEYELTNVPAIPRDPGRTSAYNFGVGLSKVRGPATFAVDAIFEPIWSYTWADAAEPVVTVLGDTIPLGGKTIENRFRFANALVRMGISRDVDLRGLGRAAGIQLGLVVRSVHYRLAQYDDVQLIARSLEEAWVEWTPTWGLTLRFPDLEIRYRGRVTNGTGRPGVQAPLGWGRELAVATGSILVAPSGPLSLQPVGAATHQISISLPLR